MTLNGTIKHGLAAALLAVGMGFGSQPAAAEPITVAVDTAFVPFEFRDPETGEYTGFDIDLWDAIMKEIGQEYELQPMDFNGIIPALQTGAVDAAVAGITMRWQREEVIDYSHAYYDSGVMLMVRADDDSIGGPDDIEGKTIAVKTGTAAADFVTKNLSAAQVTQFPNIEQAYLELQTGRVDAALHDTPNVLYYIATAGDGKVKTVGPNMDAQSYGFGFPQGSELRDKVNVAFLKLVESGKYAEIYRKWFGRDPSPR